MTFFFNSISLFLFFPRYGTDTSRDLDDFLSFFFPRSPTILHSLQCSRQAGMAWHGWLRETPHASYSAGRARKQRRDFPFPALFLSQDRGDIDPWTDKREVNQTAGSWGVQEGHPESCLGRALTMVRVRWRKNWDSPPSVERLRRPPEEVFNLHGMGKSRKGN